MSQIKLSLTEYIRYIGGNDNSRCIKEGEEVFDAGHIILYGKTEESATVLKTCAICLQTSALNANPHEIYGELQILRNKDILIKSMFCSCKAGAGGHCKHISAFLILLMRINISNLENVSKTELACAWTDMKDSVKNKYKAVPVKEMPCIKRKLEDSKLVPSQMSSETSDEILEYFIKNLPNSAVAKHRNGRAPGNSLNYTENTLVELGTKTLILNNAAQSVLMMELSNENNFHLPCCEQLYSTILNEDSSEIINISQNSPEWHKARQYRITGSRCYEIFTYRGIDWQLKSKKYFWPKSFSSKYTKHGIKYENDARAAYVLKTGAIVIECGMVILESNKWLGFSPDGLIFQNGHPEALLEIKCLYAGSTAPIEEALLSCTFLTKEDGKYVLKKKHKYHGQVQMGLAILNLQKCHLFLYSSFNDSSVIIEVLYDYDFAHKMLKTIKTNYFQKMLHMYYVNLDLTNLL